MMDRLPHALNGKVLYQIYPRSFFDSNNDGIGDIKGITKKLGYLRGDDYSLGVDIIWISPFYTSPMADFGYDVSNYLDVDPIFGTIDDFDELLVEAHRRGLKVFIDFVPNHSSDEHPWFKESRSNRKSQKRDWYVWKNPRNGAEPNNWQSMLGGPAWTYDELTDQYYLHSFLSRQPDLNWDNPHVRAAMLEQMRFWLDKGVDGFRIDAVLWLSKDPAFRDEPLADEAERAKGNVTMRSYSQAGPHLYEYLRQMADLIESYNNRFMVIEAYPNDWNDMVAYHEFYQQLNPKISAPFNFAGIFAPWEAHSFRSYIDTFLNKLDDTHLPIFCLGNHDRSRIASRFGPEASKTAAMLLLSLPGMPTLYYGDELGMTDQLILPHQVQDPYEKNLPGLGLGRDPFRTPMAWEDAPNAGFSARNPWLPTGESQQISVQRQMQDPASLLNMYRQLIAVRSKNEAISVGDYKVINVHPHVFGFLRSTNKQTAIVLLNFSTERVKLEHELVRGVVGVSTHQRQPHETAGWIELQPYEGVIIFTGSLKNVV